MDIDIFVYKTFSKSFNILAGISICLKSSMFFISSFLMFFFFSTNLKPSVATKLKTSSSYDIKTQDNSGFILDIAAAKETDCIPSIKRSEFITKLLPFSLFILKLLKLG